MTQTRKRTAAPTQPTRRYKTTQQVTHDLYKLNVSKFKRNIAWAEGAVEYVSLEHCHFFHTIDKNGAPLTTSTPIGGHFHIMELITPATEDSPAEYRVSGPKKWLLYKENGRQVKRMADVGTHDTHTHDVEYLQSEDFKPSKINSEALKLAATLAPPPSDHNIVG